jgi:hypothetical protein
MAIIGERTEHVSCKPPELGGSGDSSPHTAAGASLLVSDIDTAKQDLARTGRTPAGAAGDLVRRRLGQELSATSPR